MSGSALRPYHGSQSRHVIPTYGLGQDKHDYGKRSYDVPSATLVQIVRPDDLLRAYGGLHDLDLALAVEKVGESVGKQHSDGVLP